jgi:integrase
MSVARKSEDGRIVIFARDDSPNFFCRFHHPGLTAYEPVRWVQRSTGVRDIDRALDIAVEMLHDAEFRMKHGLTFETRTFADVTRLYKQEIQEEWEAGFRNDMDYQNYTAIIDRYLNPYFGKMKIDQIRLTNIADYNAWRKVYWMSGPGSTTEMITYFRYGKEIKRPSPKGKPPGKGTQNRENVVLRGVFRTAASHGFIEDARIPRIVMEKRKREKTKKRGAFTREEYDTLAQFLFDWRHEKHCKNADRRWLLRNYFLFLVHSGLRAGTEADNLTWADVKEISTSAGDERFVLNVDGKTGHRSPVVSGPGYTALNQIRADLMLADTEVTPDMPVFCLPDGTHIKNDTFRGLFTKALNKTGLRHDTNGTPRTIYSCRHTYATFQLLYQKVSIYTLSEQMGTGIRMIEQHYGHLTPQLAIDELTARSIDDVIADTVIDDMTKNAAPKSKTPAKPIIEELTKPLVIGPFMNKDFQFEPGE